MTMDPATLALHCEVERPAEAIFLGQRAEDDIARLLGDIGAKDVAFVVRHENESIELLDAPPEWRLTPIAQEMLSQVGFAMAFLRHTDDWITAYALKREPERLKRRGKGFHLNIGTVELFHPTDGARIPPQ